MLCICFCRWTVTSAIDQTASRPRIHPGGGDLPFSPPRRRSDPLETGSCSSWIWPPTSYSRQSDDPGPRGEPLPRAAKASICRISSTPCPSAPRSPSGTPERGAVRVPLRTGQGLEIAADCCGIVCRTKAANPKVMSDRAETSSNQACGSGARKPQTTSRVFADQDQRGGATTLNTCHVSRQGLGLLPSLDQGAATVSVR